MQPEEEMACELGETASEFIAGWIRAWDAEVADGQRVNAATVNDDGQDPLAEHVKKVLTNAIYARVEHEERTCQETETLSKPDGTLELKYAEVIESLFIEGCHASLEESEYAVASAGASSSAGQKRPREEE